MTEPPANERDVLGEYGQESATEDSTMQEIKNAVCLALIGLVIGTLLQLLLCCPAKADCVLAFGATWCGPCQQMKPIESQLRKEGYDIRCVDVDEHKAMKAAYHVGMIPCFIYVAETPAGNFECGRIVGKCSAGQLRRLCTMPVAATVGAAARNTVRVLLLPFPLLEW